MASRPPSRRVPPAAIQLLPFPRGGTPPTTPARALGSPSPRPPARQEAKTHPPHPGCSSTPRGSRFHLRRDAQRVPSLGAGRKSAWQGPGAAILSRGGSEVGGRGRATVFIPRRLAPLRLLFPVLPGVGKSWVERAKKEEGKGLGEGYVRGVLAPGIRWGLPAQVWGPGGRLDATWEFAAGEPRGRDSGWGGHAGQRARPRLRALEL